VFCALHLAGDSFDWDIEELHRATLTIYPVPSDINPQTLAEYDDPDDIELALVKRALRVYQERVDRFSPEWMNRAERAVMLNTVDQLWQRHLTDLDILREGIGLVGYGGRDPLVEYQRQSYEMWNALQEEIKTKVVQDIYRVVPPEQQPQRRLPALILQRSLSNVQAGRGAEQPLAIPQPQDGHAIAAGQSAGPQTIENIGIYDEVGRNDPCPCGSGKKFKHCHYKEIQGHRQTVPQSKVKQRGSTRRRR
jgi:preprotein translocase subunit SecA